MRLFRAIIAATLLAHALPAVGVDIELVTVADPGNPADMRYHLDLRPEGFGRVDYVYEIGTYEVTAGQYTGFLNAVAATDTFGLYDEKMDRDLHPELSGTDIKRAGVSGAYTYSVAPDWSNRPMRFVVWGRAVRFANWLSNGQRTGAQDASTTEDGSYALNGATTNEQLAAVARKPGASWVIPTEDEWYKAAYFDPAKPGGAGYWEYPTRSNDRPSNVLDPTGANNANYNLTQYTIGPPYYTTEVGAFASSPSAYGTFDQGGNAYEWNEALIIIPGSKNRGTRGGSAIASGVHLSAWDRTAGLPADRGGDGFRVALVPEPATLGMLAAVGLTLLLRRRWPAA